MNKLLAGVAGVVASVVVAGTAADAATINIYAWTTGNQATLIGTSNTGTLTLNGSVSGLATFSAISGSTAAPGALDLAQALTLNLSGALSTAVHVAVEVTGITSPYVSGNLSFTSGFANSGITTGLTVGESTHLGTVCTTTVAVGGTCAAFAANTSLGSATFVGPQLSGNASALANAITPATYSVFDQFDFSGGAAGGAANVNISLNAAVPAPVLGAGLPGLIAACGGLLALARRRRQQRS
jgi:hypothetical protein